VLVKNETASDFLQSSPGNLSGAIPVFQKANSVRHNETSTKTIKRTALKSSKSVKAGIVYGDAAAVLKTLPADVFNVAVTSPPYYWVRDYGFDNQLGHEESVEAYISALMAVFDEVKRTLHPEGVFFLNIGDTYYSGNGQPHGEDPKCSSRNFLRTKLRPVDQSGWSIPKKSLIGIPWKVALTMQERGWTLRSAIIWNRINAFVEPTARDRPHRQYEHVFMFSKSRFYSFDRSALPEQDVWNIPIERSRRADHNASFPKELVRRCVVTGSPPGGKVLDPFVGSGTTTYVSSELGRTSVGIDLGKSYITDLLRTLAKNDFRESDWSEFVRELKREPAGWKKWAGNKANYRKPRSAIR
jgi:site-specific DNA-methyltransferase (adenine-specific)